MLTADAALAAVRSEHGVDYRLEGRYPGGEVGAYYARAPDGRLLVFKWSENLEDLAHLVQVSERVNRLRAKGYPAPSYLAPLATTRGVLIFQEVVTGAWRDDFGAELVEEALSLNDLQAGEGEGGDGWSEYMKRTLTAGADGACLHDSLEGFSPVTRDLLAWIEQIGSHLGHLPSADLVHVDFHHRNMLRDGGLTAVVDWEGCLQGDRAFDLVTFWFGFTHARAPKELADRVWERAAGLTSHEALEAYFAHMALRRLDWTIRHHAAADVELLLGWIAVGRAQLGG